MLPRTTQTKADRPSVVPSVFPQKFETIFETQFPRKLHQMKFYITCMDKNTFSSDKLIGTA